MSLLTGLPCIKIKNYRADLHTYRGCKDNVNYKAVEQHLICTKLRINSKNITAIGYFDML